MASQWRIRVKERKGGRRWREGGKKNKWKYKENTHKKVRSEGKVEDMTKKDEK